MADYDIRRLVDLARRGYFRIRPVYAPGVDPLSTDESAVVGFDFYRAGRRIRVFLDQLPPEARAPLRDALLDLAGIRVLHRVRTIFDPDTSPRDDLRMTVVYRGGRPSRVVFSAPGIRPVAISVRDFLPLIRGIERSGYDTAVAHLRVRHEGQIKDLWIIGSRESMRPVGYMIQQGQLPLEIFEQRGPVLFMNADRYYERLPFVPTEPVEYVRRGIWVYSP